MAEAPQALLEVSVVRRCTAADGGTPQARTINGLRYSFHVVQKAVGLVSPFKLGVQSNSDYIRTLLKMRGRGQGFDGLLVSILHFLASSSTLFSK